MEAGHAVVAYKLPLMRSPNYASIERKGKSRGRMQAFRLPIRKMAEISGCGNDKEFLDLLDNAPLFGKTHHKNKLAVGPAGDDAERKERELLTPT